MNSVKGKVGSDEQMYLIAGRFDDHGGVPEQYRLQMALPNAACPGLLQKPLDAAIRQLLAPYCPSGRQGNRQTNNI